MKQTFENILSRSWSGSVRWKKYIKYSSNFSIYSLYCLQKIIIDESMQMQKTRLPVKISTKILVKERTDVKSYLVIFNLRGISCGREKTSR